MLEKITNEDEKRKYDHQQTTTQRMFIESVDRFLDLKPADSQWSFVNIACVKDFNEARSIVQNSSLNQVLAGEDEQLAMKSDGSYYPILDITKRNATFVGASVRAWGWEDQKVRYSRDENDEMSGYIVYENEKDHTRQLDISFHYRHGEEYVVETVSLYGGTMDRSNPQLNSQVWMSAYAETGYEGHGGKATDSASDELVAEFIDIAERLTGAVTDN